MDIKQLQDALGYQFQQPELLLQAVTHGSHKRGSKRHALDYQRMEFLGDAVLGMIVSEILYHSFPTEKEGELARRKAQLIAGSTLVEIASRWQLQHYMRLSLNAGESERAEASMVEDVLEAIIGAMYLDGGFAPVRQWVHAIWVPLAEASHQAPKDPKTALQEWTQARQLGLPEYVEIQRTGPSHAPVFVMEVRIQGLPPCQAEAASKRAASVLAAESMLQHIQRSVL